MPECSIDIAGRRVAFTESTGGDRAVVLVHGNSSSSRTWRRLTEGPFGERFRCLALDLPGHGRSAPAADVADYALPGYAEVVVAFADAVGATDAVFVGWSLGGHILLEAAPLLPDAAGLVVFGTPPMGTPDQLAQAFLPNPAMQVGFSEQVDDAAARAYADSFVAPGSTLSRDPFVADILATDGRARAGLAASIGQGRFADEVEAVARLRRPLAVLHGAGEQLVSLDYLRAVPAPTLWRGEVQVLPGAGHAPHEETPAAFAALLTDFADDLG